MGFNPFIKKCVYGDGKPATNKVAGQDVCGKHGRELKQIGGQSEAQAGRPGKAVTTRKRSQS